MKIFYAVIFFIFVSLGFAQTQTPAGTTITNQAFATYTDSAGNEQTAESLPVTTIVQPVYSFVITPDGNNQATPGQTEIGRVTTTVQFEYTVTNQGNDADTINLSVVQPATDGYNLENVQIYLDEDGDGVLDPGEPLVTSVDDLAASDSVQLIVVGTIPADAGNETFANINLVGISAGDPSFTDTNNWARAAALTGADLSLEKTATPSTGIVPGSTTTYTLSGENTGGSSPFVVDNVATVNGTLRDGILVSDDLPAGLTYQGGSATQSVTTSSDSETILIIYSTNGGATWTTTQPVSGVNAVGLLIQDSGQLSPGDPVFTYSLSFNVQVPAAAAAGTSYTNVGELRFDADGDFDDDDAGEVVTTPGVIFTVEQTEALALGPNDYPAGDAPGDTYTQGDVTITRSGDTQTVPSINNGRTVTFVQSLTNGGNAADTFTLSSTAPAGFPGTVTITNLGGTAITTLALAAGATGDFLVTIELPDDYTSAAPLDFTLTATSGNEPTLSDSTTNTLGKVVEDDFAAVDIGNGDGDEATAPDQNPVTQTTTPDSTVSFTLEIVNGGNNSDTFGLSTVFTAGISGQLFADVDCDGVSDGGAPITATGPLDPAETFCLVAVVTVPAGTNPADYTFTTTATSQTDPAQSDSITNTVQVQLTETFTFEPDASDTTTPNGVVTYTHTITNSSNSPATVAFSVTEPGTPAWTYEYSLDGTNYFSTVGDISGFTVAANGGTQQVFVRVTVPADAPDAYVDSFTLTATPTFTVNGVPTSGTADSVTDTTTVQAGTLTLVKTVDNSTAAPGDTLVYTIVGENNGTGAISNVQIFDSLPQFTGFVSVSATSTVSGTVLYSTDGTTWSASAPTTLGAGGTFYVGVSTDGNNTISATDTFTAGGTLTVTFTVEVQ